MARRRAHTPLNVFMNNRLVGQLARQKGGAISFQYDDTWLDWDARLPVSLSLPLRADKFTGAAVVAVFENLLPDNDAILKRVAERSGATGTDAYSMLSAIGRDCVGALQFLPEDEEPAPSTQIEGNVLTERQIDTLLKNLDVSPLGIRSEHDFRISIAGAQEKTALLYHEGQWFEPIGTTPTTHILKPQIGKLSNGMDMSHSVENEYFCMTLMRNFGLNVANVEIERFGKQNVLIVERFDRLWTKDGRLLRLPQEDCCQALSVPPTRKYENSGGPGIPAILELLRGSDEPSKDQRDFFKANLLFWLIGATDGHAKNFSIQHSPGGRFRMAPLYDILTAEADYAANRIRRKDYKLAMRWGDSGNYKIVDIFKRHMLETGVAGGLSRTLVEEVLSEIVSEASGALEKTIAALPKGFPQVLVDVVAVAIKDRLQRLT
ncbi:type II toxin-antitoxin system HipA family toxin [Ponticaulis sp.]|uniref:type II toxin-antitoxin system HipA family toxin n=1 Tax=Ponticaulis sp. TaxID=2020902 RepID=UPI000B6A806C|nr:type II toxin-antitoxin system HipA family toxin [Ponticaulis sp.]MAI91307.1 toxin HipA [Ponticaulis sp.]OUX97909.1 MAG: toxin HipA [Hyphomonadaceae bacterium TMED5]|tara:strand:- start:73921 stop:75222 length:1302 start_codon:yes stop_codon:yes gene_type:complete